MGRHIQYADLGLEEFRRMARVHVEALNHALQNVPPDRVRMHVCWGNYEGPHHYDVPLADIIDIVFPARPAGVSFEAANPRHAHEWRLFERVRVPEGKVLIPGVLESKTNYIEHPELVAQRIGRYAKLVGRENVIAGTDCGFGSWVGQAAVDPGVVWAKLGSLAAGARLARASSGRSSRATHTADGGTVSRPRQEAFLSTPPDAAGTRTPRPTSPAGVRHPAPLRAGDRADAAPAILRPERDGRLNVEYADVLGIPFDFTAKPVVAPP